MTILYQSSIDADYKVIFISPEIEILIGYPADSVKFIPDFIHPDDKQRYCSERTEAIQRGGMYKISYRLLHRFWGVVLVEEKAFLNNRGDGEKAEVLGTIERISFPGIKRYSSINIFEALPEAIIVTDVNSVLVDCNRKMLDMLREQDKARYVGVKLLELFSVRHRKVLARILERVKCKGEVCGLRLSIQDVDGNEIYTEQSIAVVRDKQAQPLFFIVSVKNIGKRKSVERRLLKSEEQFKKLVGNVPGVVYRSHWIDMHHMEFISNQIYDLSGIKSCDIINGKCSFLSFIVPGDQSHVITTIDKALKQGRSYELSYRILHNNGEIRWVYEKGEQVEISETGEIICGGVMLDISELRLSESSLRRERLRTRQYLDIAGTMLMALDYDGVIIMLNQKGQEITGFSEQEIQNKNWFDICIPPNYKREYQRDYIDLMEGKLPSNSQFIYHIIIKCGERRVLQVNQTPVFDEDGEVSGVLLSGEDITDKIKVLDALKMSEEKFRLITESANLIICEMDQVGLVTYANSAFEMILGYSPREMLEKSLMELMHIDEQLLWAKELRDINRDDISRTIHLRFYHKNGRIVTLRTRVNTIINSAGDKAIVVIGADITDQLRAQEQLRRSVSLYRVLASNVPYLDLFLFDSTMRFLLAAGNEFVEGERNSDYFEGKLMKEALPVEIGEILEPLFLLALRGTPVSRDFKFDDKHYFIQVLPIMDEFEKVSSGLCIIQNVTEEYLIRQNLQKSKILAEEANQAKSQFIANMSHEIRTPLNAIMGFSEQLQKYELGELQTQFVDIISRSSEHLLTIVNEILVLSKIEAGRMPLDNRPFILASVFRDVYNTYKIIASNKQIGFDYQLEQMDDVMVVGDMFRFRQILTNLVDNALKFTEKGKVKMNALINRIDDNKIGVIVEICDTGIGIEMDKSNLIFEHFHQADSSITRKYGGSGLGLTISKKLIEMMGGSLELESMPGQGSCFTVNVPFEYCEAGIKEVLVQEREIDYNLLKGKSALLVDDDVINLQLGAIILGQLGMRVDTAQSGEEALLSYYKNHYDIMCLDIHMPEMSGLEVAAQIQENPSDINSHMAVMAVTAIVIKEDLETYKSVGISDYLLKPFKEIQLYNKIRDILNISSGNYNVNIDDIVCDKDSLDTGEQMYNLKDLRHITGDDIEFFNSMIKTFIESSEENMLAIQHAMAEENYLAVGEIAHKMISAYRHINAKELVVLIEQLEQNMLYKKAYQSAKELVTSIISGSEALLVALKQELQ